MSEDLLALLGILYALLSFAAVIALGRGLMPEHHDDWEATGPQVLGLVLLIAILVLTSVSFIVEGR